MPSRQQVMDAAELFDTWRVIPRIILLGYSYWMARVTDWVIRWYENLPTAERTGQVTAFVTVVLPGIFGLAVWVYKIYADGGRDWSADPKSLGATRPESQK